jgi:hypothetical protein
MTGYDRLHKDGFIILDKGHEAGVPIDINDEDPLAGVLFLVGVFDRVQQSPVSQMVYHFLKRDTPPLVPQPFDLFVAPVKQTYGAKVALCVHFGKRHLRLLGNGAGQSLPRFA